MTVLEQIKQAFADGPRSHVRHISGRSTCASLDTTAGAEHSSGSRLSLVVNLWRTVRRFVREFRQPIRRRALLIGIAYKERGDWALKGTHGDVDRVQKLLVGHYRFRPEDIIVMKDCKDVEDHLWPTEQNIRRELGNFTVNCGPRDRFFFLYAGHAEQKNERIKGSEEDGKDEYIIPYDAPDMNGTVCIEDNDLSRYLVKPLKPHCKLVALLDACHSATLLDLTHDKCLDIGYWWGRVMNLLHHALDFLGIALPEPVEPPREDGPVVDGTTENMCRNVAVPMMERLVKPWRFCRGLCRRTVRPDVPFVLCISSCKDHESAIDTRKVSMTKMLVEVLEASESPSLAELLTSIRAKLASAYEAQCTKHWKRKAQKAGIGGLLLLIPLAWFRLAPDNFWSFLLHGEEVPRYPKLAPVQMASNFPRRTAVERFWL